MSATPGTVERTREALRPGRAELIVLIVAIAVRAVHLIGLLDDPLMAEPRMDPRYHHDWAVRILAGELVQDQPFFRAPLYPYALAVVYALTDYSVVAAKSFSLFLGVLVPLCVVRIGRRLFDAGVALGAGLAMAVYPLALRFDGDLLLEGMFVVLVMVALELELRALEAPRRRRFLVAGVCFGLAAITRPNILAFVVLVPFVHAWLRRRGIYPPAGPAWREAVLIGAGVCLPIVPVALHNLAAGDFVPIATQAGVNFYIGNNPASDGFTAIVPGTRATWWGGHDDAVMLAETARGRALRPSEASDHWLGEGLAFWRDDPGGAIRLFLRKLYLFWWGAEISNNEHVYYLSQYSPPMRALLWGAGIFMPFGLLAPLGLVGLVLAAQRTPRAWPVVIFTVAYMGSVVLFFVCARFRYPIVPALILFASFAVARMLRDRIVRRSALPAVLLLTVVLNVDPFGLRPAVFGAQALSYLDLGVYHVGEREDDAAFAALQRSAEYDPGHPGPHAWMGKLYLRRGELEAAEASLRLATRGDTVLFRDVVTMAQKDLGRLYLQSGRPQLALGVFQAALELRPSYDQAVLGVGYAARDLGDRGMAVAYFRRVLELDPNNRAAAAELERLDAAAASPDATPR